MKKNLVHISFPALNSHPANLPSGRYVIYVLSGDGKVYLKFGTNAPVLVGKSGLTYKGAWNASTNSPSLASGVGESGDYYVVSVTGTTNIDGINDWGVNDWIIFNGTSWQKIDNSETIQVINDASESVKGIIEIATDGETQAMTDAQRAVVPLKLGVWWTYIKTLVHTFVEKITFSKGVNLGNNTSPSANGDVWYNTTSNVFQGRANAANLDFVTGIQTAFIVATPSTVNGSAGDKAGQISYDNNHFWFCFQDYVNPSTACWLKIPRSPDNPIDLVVATPANLTASGFAGQYAEDARWLYFCVATNTWRRIDKKGLNVQTLSANKAMLATDVYCHILNPNGSNRDVTLHASPILGDCFFFKNSGNEDLVVKNNGGTTIITLSPVNGQTQSELVYDGTNWQVTIV